MNYYVADAFTSEVFGGNPAGVCVLEKFLETSLMQKIATENRYSETAFVCPREDGDYDLRWFSPGAEVDLCGHATLATAHILATFVEPTKDLFGFHTRSGRLTATRVGPSRYELDFPSRKPVPIPVTEEMCNGLGFVPQKAWLARNLIVLGESAESVREYTPDFDAMRTISTGRGLTLTAKGDESDFVCRVFIPKFSIDEDPVCGSAHTELTPLWSEVLDQKELVSYQLSSRVGVLYCRDEGERIKISGDVAVYLVGELYVDGEHT